MQTVWLMEILVQQRHDEIRRQVAEARRPPACAPLPSAPRARWRVRLGWRLVEVGLRLALPGSERRALTAGTRDLAVSPLR